MGRLYLEVVTFCQITILIFISLLVTPIWYHQVDSYILKEKAWLCLHSYLILEGAYGYQEGGENKRYN